MLHHLLAEADPVQGYIVAGLLLVFVVGVVWVGTHLATDRDHFPDRDIDSLPSTLHGPEFLFPPPVIVSRDGRDERGEMGEVDQTSDGRTHLYPFGGMKGDESK